MSPPPTDKLAYWSCAGSIIARVAKVAAETVQP